MAVQAHPHGAAQSHLPRPGQLPGHLERQQPSAAGRTRAVRCSPGHPGRTGRGRLEAGLQQFGLLVDRPGGVRDLWKSLRRHQGNRPERHLPLLHVRRPTTLRDKVLCRRLNSRPRPSTMPSSAPLLSAYEDTDLFAEAISEAQERADLDESPHDAERAALQAELDKVERGIDRYLRAFEAGTMPEEICGERVKDLGTKATAMRARMFELDAEMTTADLVAPTSAELNELRQRVEAAVAGGSSALVKSLLQALIHAIRVDSREATHPAFRVPVGGGHHEDDAVRAPSRSVEVTSLACRRSRLSSSKCRGRRACIMQPLRHPPAL